MQAAQRAFVYTSSLDWAPVGDSVRISPIWANSGTTPTRRLRIATNWKASHGELPADFDINYVRAPESLFLGPNSNAEFGTLLIPMRDIQAAIEERLHLYVWGRATYEDMFEDSQPHTSTSATASRRPARRPTRSSCGSRQFGLSNGSDEDSRKADERDYRQRRAAKKSRSSMRGGVGADAAIDLGPVVAGRRCEEAHAVVDGAALGIGRAVVEPADAGERDRRRAHGAGLERDMQVAVGQALRAERSRGGADRDQLGVGGRVAVGRWCGCRPRR